MEVVDIRLKLEGNFALDQILNFRYHLYVSYACPWAHRTLIVRELKGLQNAISYDVVDHFLDKSTGWSLLSKSPDAHGDTVNGFKYLREAYLKSNPDYDGAVTVP